MLELESPDPKRDSGFGFDWSLIQSFLAVIDEGSLLAAARRTGSSQPTIGRHIDALESVSYTHLTLPTICSV